MMILAKELEIEIKEKLRHVSKPFDLISIWRLAGIYESKLKGG